ncbi:right-handed parallel beta-helix repeat-containing protein [Rubinisphaera margarita]|uniref:right-handed parallel beta-helix repeat-containing protein n=1 Tax=Rubinisphaera margarita TaxID=2909586 RepID=UPI001EE7CC24|nr:right-handed parallel beta-helix repeat-containing protein [Rubinisphaera margarita]MCG6156375.1 right-handed parallel beta-helix repeat-containing protein [Rubinisphaera margarita]
MKSTTALMLTLVAIIALTGPTFPSMARADDNVNQFADHTAALTAALQSGNPIRLDGLHLRVTQPIVLDWSQVALVDVDGGHPSRSSITFEGVAATHLQMTGMPVSFKNITIHCSGTVEGPFAAVHLRHCHNARLENVVIQNPDNFGILLYECDGVELNRCRVDNSEDRYQADQVGTAIQLSGCSSTRVVGCRARFSNFTYSVIAKEFTDNAESSPGELVMRDVSETVGNVFRDCTVDRFRGTAFNVNGANFTVFEGCVATNQHPGSPFAAFQVKHPNNGPRTSHNRFESCSAQDVFSGFYAQGGSRNSFSSCSTLRTQRFGFRLNFAENCLITNCIADEFAIRDEETVNGGFVIRQSNGCIIDNCTATPHTGCPPTTALISIERDSSNNLIGNFSASGKSPTGIRIDAKAPRNRVSEVSRIGLDTAAQPVVDESKSTIWSQ